MHNEAHDLIHDFPEHKQRIHDLKISNTHFARLFDEYNSVTKELHRIAQQIETPSDAYTENLKKKSLKLKDELFEML